LRLDEAGATLWGPNWSAGSGDKEVWAERKREQARAAATAAAAVAAAAAAASSSAAAAANVSRALADFDALGIPVQMSGNPIAWWISSAHARLRSKGVELTGGRDHALLTTDRSRALQEIMSHRLWQAKRGHALPSFSKGMVRRAFFRSLP
jgi:hypothetical protein